MRITTWNINSVRLRLDGLRRLLDACRPDVVCLQEIKVVDDLFPHAAIEALGLPHRFVHGQGSYHGVAILAKLPFEEPVTFDWGAVGHARHQRVTLPGGVHLHNVYVPAGGDVPDPEENPKFRHKLEFVAHLAEHSAHAGRDGVPAIFVGDLNIAPLETDVWSHRQLLKVVSHTPVEVEAFGRFLAARPWTDAVRRFVPAEQKLFTWWSYRNRDWRASNRGRRLDHVLVTPDLAAGLRAADVLKDARDWPLCSDHVPVTVELALTPLRSR